MNMLHEELARERMRADHLAAARRREVNRMVAQRRWRAVARFVQRRLDGLDG